jgi:tellurium resistance protein TerZ
MVMGVFYVKNDEWKFNAIGEPTKDRKLEETVNTVMRNFL